jgi:hypothetical protein
MTSDLILPFNHIIKADFRHGQHRVVMVYIIDPGYSTYSTYRVDSLGGCYWGHYYTDDLMSAFVDFEGRVKSIIRTMEENDQ